MPQQNPLPVEIINERIDYWLERQDEALRAVAYAERQIDIHLGMKALHLVGSEPPAEKPVEMTLHLVPDIIA